jgi:outer membrane cobalamin receptor
MPPAGTNRTAFTPADFAQFNPQNVLVMVRRVPGFAIQSDGGGNRGLG